MVGLSGCVLVQVPEVHRAAGGAVMLGNDHNAVLPPSGSVDGDPLEHAQPAVPVQALFNSQLPVEGDLGWNMHCYRLDSRVKVELEGRTALHEGELLLFTAVECRGSISFHNPGF